MTRDESYYANVRQKANEFWNSLQALKALQPQWNALDYGNTLAAGEGVNDGISAAQLGAVVFDTADAVSNLMANGHATNVTKLLY